MQEPHIAGGKRNGYCFRRRDKEWLSRSCTRARYGMIEPKTPQLWPNSYHRCNGGTRHTRLSRGQSAIVWRGWRSITTRTMEALRKLIYFHYWSTRTLLRRRGAKGLQRFPPRDRFDAARRYSSAPLVTQSSHMSEKLMVPVSLSQPSFVAVVTHSDDSRDLAGVDSDANFKARCSQRKGDMKWSTDVIP